MWNVRQGRKLDCVYYYMRSLAASNPFLSARESLMQLFDDAAKKVRFRPILTCFCRFILTHKLNAFNRLWHRVAYFVLVFSKKNYPLAHSSVCGHRSSVAYTWGCTFVAAIANFTNLCTRRGFLNHAANLRDLKNFVTNRGLYWVKTPKS